MSSRSIAIVPLLLALVAAPLLASAQPVTSHAPAGWDADARLAEAPDTNPDPNVVEIAITARVADVEVAPGTRVHAWTYNGGIPGPAHPRQGRRSPDRPLHQRAADEPTTMHWHGVRVPIEMDGVPDISQPAVKPGESFTYDFVVRDAGLYWYHPHVMSAAQVGLRALRRAAGRGSRPTASAWPTRSRWC